MTQNSETNNPSNPTILPPNYPFPPYGYGPGFYSEEEEINLLDYLREKYTNLEMLEENNSSPFMKGINE